MALYNNKIIVPDTIKKMTDVEKILLNVDQNGNIVYAQPAI
jgi:hypothetical protein